ncbi:UDP-N-acetylmuramoyl-tripeptide--D-alanyl-D-alanine ligase [Candidatus Omnitrophota bacterium]
MFTVKEILRATKGQLPQGNSSTKIRGISTDTRTLKAGELFITLKGRNFKGQEFVDAALKKSASGIIVEQSIKHTFPNDFVVIKVKNTLIALGDIANFHRRKLNPKVIAITGSSGKTTAKDMLACILSKKYNVLKTKGNENNQVGVPLTLLKLRRKHDIAVVELGTNHPGEIKRLVDVASPDIGILINIGLSHIEFLKDFEGVYREKLDLFKGLKRSGAILFNYDDTYLRRIKRQSKNGPSQYTFGLRDGCSFQVSNVIKQGAYIKFLLNQKTWIRIRSFARHNIYNCLAAVACARICNVSYKTIREALERFNFPVGRGIPRTINGIKIIDDTYNSNPLSLSSAIDSLSEYTGKRKILICADMLELGKQSQKLHFDIGRKIAASNIDMLMTLGDLSYWVSQGAKRNRFSGMTICHCRNHQDVINRLHGTIRSNDVILVKGSRSMQMEKIVKDIQKKLTKNKKG